MNQQTIPQVFDTSGLTEEYKNYGLCYKRETVRLPQFHMSLYYRIAFHFIEDERALCFDIANVTIDERHRGKGFFRQFLQQVEQEADKQDAVVFVESVMNPRFQKFLMDRGYKRQGQKAFDNAFNFYRTPQEKG